MDRDGFIGRDGGIPWDLPEDRSHFRRITLGHPVVMGRRTFESIGIPLAGRKNIVLSKDASRRLPGVTVASSPAEALEAAAAAEEAFVIGGEQIYRLFLPCARRLYVTHLEARVGGDRRFPEVRWNGWRVVAESVGTTADPPLRFRVYERIDGQEGGGP